MMCCRLTLLACASLAVLACRSDPAPSAAPTSSAAVAETPQASPPVIDSAPSLKPPVDLPSASPVVATTVLHKRLLGLWSFEPSAATKKKLIDEFKRTSKDPNQAQQAAKGFEEALSHMVVEITPDTMITKQMDKEVGREKYEVIREEAPDRITVRMAVSKKEQMLVFKDDRTVDLHDDRMGQVVLRKR